ncbi:hypothetical protein [Rhodobacter calidifons]|uniref:Response regulatory domain-containing protein n=1 Tax=Rhodobacter calidifons TaxID=2715277 RepID=A0ABX0G3B1_9RHOB|nr:hypothetical protein [Rhodobacter calidifons]NHB75698.1 hypothetical protein [Rhodobacter calidifons]
MAIVQDVMPDTRMLVAGSAEQAMTLLQDARVDIAFLNLSPLELARSDLVRQLEQTGATVILLGHEADALATRHRFLELPFVSSAIAAELRDVLDRVLGQSSRPGGGRMA